MTTPAADPAELEIASERSQQPGYHELIAIVLRDPTLDFEAKRKLLDDLKKFRRPADDRWVYWIAVSVLGVISLTAVLTMALSGNPTALPDGLLALGSAAVGALAGVLTPAASSRSRDGGGGAG